MIRILLALMFYFPSVSFADAVIFSGLDVKALKTNLDLFGTSKLMGLSVDPTAGAGVAAPLSSIGMNYLTGNAYIKTGAGNTAWNLIPVSAGPLAGDRVVITDATGKLTVVAAGTAGQPLLSNGASVASFGNIDLSTTTALINLLPLTKGGSNKSITASAGSMLYTDADSFESTAVGTSGEVMLSNGASAPAFGAASLSGIGITGILPLAKGGTNKLMTPILGGVVWTDVDSQEVTAAGTSGQVLLSNGAAAPSFGAVSLSGSGVTGIVPLANGGTNKNMTAVDTAVVYSDANSQELSDITKLAWNPSTNIMSLQESRSKNGYYFQDSTNSGIKYGGVDFLGNKTLAIQVDGSLVDPIGNTNKSPVFVKTPGGYVNLNLSEIIYSDDVYPLSLERSLTGLSVEGFFSNTASDGAASFALYGDAYGVTGRFQAVPNTATWPTAQRGRFTIQSDSNLAISASDTVLTSSDGIITYAKFLTGGTSAGFAINNTALSGTSKYAKALIELQGNGVLKLNQNATATRNSFSLTNLGSPIAFNTDLNAYEGYANSAWGSLTRSQVSASLSLGAAGSIAVFTSEAFQQWRVSGTSAITMSTTPFGATAPLNGAEITLIGTSDTNTVSITSSDIAKGVIFPGGSLTLSNRHVAIFTYNSTDDRYYLESSTMQPDILSGTRQTGTSISAATVLTPYVSDRQVAFVVGNAGPVIVTATTPITVTGMQITQSLKICGTSDTNTVTYNNGVNLVLNGTAVLGKDQCLDLSFLGTDGTNLSWVEQGRNF